MSYCVYIIYSEKLDRYYVGYSENITIRLEQHNKGLSAFTAKVSDWKIVYQKSFPTRQQAHQREKKIKSKKSRKYIQWLISSTD